MQNAYCFEEAGRNGLIDPKKNHCPFSLPCKF